MVQAMIDERIVVPDSDRLFTADRPSLWQRFCAWLTEPYFVGEWVYWTQQYDPRLKQRAQEDAAEERFSRPWLKQERCV